MANGTNRLLGVPEGPDEIDSCLVVAKRIRVDLPTRQDQRVIVRGRSFIQRPVNRDRTTPILLIPALYLALFRRDDVNGGARFPELLQRNLKFRLLEAVGGQDGYFLASKIMHYQPPSLGMTVQRRGAPSVPQEQSDFLAQSSPEKAVKVELLPSLQLGGRFRCACRGSLLFPPFCSTRQRSLSCGATTVLGCGESILFTPERRHVTVEQVFNVMRIEDMERNLSGAATQLHRSGAGTLQAAVLEPPMPLGGRDRQDVFDLPRDHGQSLDPDKSLRHTVDYMAIGIVVVFRHAQDCQRRIKSRPLGGAKPGHLMLGASSAGRA